MNACRLCFALSLVACTLPARAADKDHPAEAAAPVLMAAAEPIVSLTHVSTAAVDPKPGSAGVAENLPDLPVESAMFSVRALLTQAAFAQQAASSRLAIVALPKTPGVSLLQASPLASMARHLGAEHFNTEDGSSVDAFAICYRLSKRSSVQVIPGDPAPIKIPVTTMANNMGVTVGMVLRLSKPR